MPNLLSEGLTENPDGLEDADLHKRSLALVEPIMEGQRRVDEDRFNSLFGNGSALAATKPEEIVNAARYGRVETLFVAVDDHLWGQIDEDSDRLVAHREPQDGDEDLLDYAAAHTLLKGGQVNAVSREQVPQNGRMAAIFRY
jgi:hypothetical protein